ncbi:MAG: sterol desaturase family protein [Wenzhouxiangella sp.]|nr:sterol desaturase family protein [Wenzhouxiangella sp.]MCH8476439.1 sterol desaturase family protein [Wenzhouxiangella sp.]TVR95144.1 MAG: sterol desaturase family protein [Wenzhouxiangellaceae bacterium]
MDLIAHEPTLRLSAFLGVFLLVVLAQRLWPARGDGRWSKRQAVNLGLVVGNTLMLRLLFPLLAVGLAVIVHEDSGGLFGWLDWPLWISIPLAIILLDAAIYWQHRLMHELPLLWRLHRVHHADTGFDVTTGVRFHPLEIALSMLIKLALIWLLGPHPLAVLIFEVLLAAGALFTHADFALPKNLDRRLRWFIVTPSMHRIHHSTWQPETDSNYGFHLSIWDRLFGSYTVDPRSDERSMPVGLESFRDDRDQGLFALLVNPFRKPVKQDRCSS